MKVLERLGLVDRIGRELQSRMSYADIDAYLKAYGINTKKPTSGVNSKWVYTKDLLADESDDVVLRIATELELPHNYVVADVTRTLEATFWEPLHFRLFLSHLSTFKVKAGLLQASLRRFGISAFVAHVDIEPTREWMEEIEAGLLSMDALAALLTAGYKDSPWTDQEVGAAIGRGVFVIPVMKGVLPYGFLSKFQGLNAEGKTITAVAEEIFRVLIASPKTRSKMLLCLTETTIQSKTGVEAITKLQHLDSVERIPQTHLKRLQEAAAASSTLMLPRPLRNR